MTNNGITSAETWTLEKVLRMRDKWDRQGIIDTLKPLMDTFESMKQSSAYQEMLKKMPSEDMAVVKKLEDEVTAEFDNACVVEMALTYNTFSKIVNEYLPHNQRITTAEKAFGTDDL